MILSVYGIADKRSVAYPLIYALNVLGRVIVLTDDTSFKRLTAGESSGDLNNGTLLILPTEELTDARVQGYLVDGYDNAVVVSCGNSSALAGSEYIHVLRENEPAEDNSVRVVYAGSKDKKSILQTGALLKELDAMEQAQLIKPMRSTAKILAPIFAPLLSRTAKETYKLLVYKFKKGAKK